MFGQCLPVRCGSGVRPVTSDKLSEDSAPNVYLRPKQLCSELRAGIEGRIHAMQEILAPQP